MTSNLTRPAASPTWDTLRDVHDRFAEMFIPALNKGNEITPKVFVLEVTDEGKPRRVAAMPDYMINAMFDTGASLQMFPRFVADIFEDNHETRTRFEEVIGFAPSIVVLVAEGMHMEANHTLQSCEAGVGSETFAREAYPALMVVLYLDDGYFPVAHRISDVPMRHCLRAPFPPEPATEQEAFESVTAREVGALLAGNATRH